MSFEWYPEQPWYVNLQLSDYLIFIGIYWRFLKKKNSGLIITGESNYKLETWMPDIIFNPKQSVEDLRSSSKIVWFRSIPIRMINGFRQLFPRPLRLYPDSYNWQMNKLSLRGRSYTGRLRGLTWWFLLHLIFEDTVHRPLCPKNWDWEYHKFLWPLIITALFTVSVVFRGQILYRYYKRYLQFRLICD